MTTNGEKEGLLGVMGASQSLEERPRLEAGTRGCQVGGPDSPNDVDQNHKLDQAEDDAHLLVAHEYHSGSVILKEESSQFILEPLCHGGPSWGLRTESLAQPLLLR